MENMWEVLTQKQKLEAFRVFAIEEKARLEKQRRNKKASGYYINFTCIKPCCLGNIFIEINLKRGEIMDKRLVRIFELVFLLNQKGENLQLNLGKNAIYVLDANCRNIIPYWTRCIYREVLEKMIMTKW